MPTTTERSERDASLTSVLVALTGALRRAADNEHLQARVLSELVSQTMDIERRIGVLSTKVEEFTTKLKGESSGPNTANLNASRSKKASENPHKPNANR